MKLTIKILAVMILAILAAPVFILHGCGKTLNGGACGGCPDSVAPAGSLVTVTTLPSPNVLPDSGACIAPVTFQFTGPDEIGLSNICVEIFTSSGSLVALRTPAHSDCSSHVASDFYSYIRTRTDKTGSVTVDYWVSTLCTSLQPKAASATFSVQAVSCGTGATASTSVTITPACP